MEKDAERFLQAEEAAVKLVETLKQLHIEATSYQTATRELDSVSKRLRNLIEATEKIINGSYEVINTLKEIGAPEILNRLKKVEANIDEESLKVSQLVEGFKKETIGKINDLKSMMNEEFTKQLKGMYNQRALLILTLASSITAVIIGIITLLR